MAILVPLEPTPAAATRSLVGLTDAELVAEVRRGSDRAFEQLYERYHRRIAAYIYGMVSDYGRAEDISQDVFMSALRRIRETERSIAFKPWVYEIAKNACIDQFRRTRRTEEVSYDAEEGLGAADYGRLVTTAPTPDVAVDQKMAIDHLRGAFGGLSQTHHKILVMREFEGLSYREIGERLGMSRPSVESTLFRARRRLGEEYEELVSGDRCLRVQEIIDAADAAAPAPAARDQRRLAAHLSHCQRCRRHAKLAGMDAAVLVASRSAPAKIAALIPLPAFLRRRWLGEEVAPVAAHHHVSTLAQLSAHFGASVDPAIASWAKAVAAAATVAVAGMAGGVAVSDVARMGPGGSVAQAPRAAAKPRAEVLPAKRAAPAVAVAPAPGSEPPARAAQPTSGEPQDAAPGAGAPAAPGAGPPAGAVGGGAAPFPGAPQSPFAPMTPGAGSVIGGLDPRRNPTSGGRLSAVAEEPSVAVLTAAAVAAAEAAASSSTASKTQLEGAAAAAAAAAAYAAAAEDAAARAAAVAAAAQALAGAAAATTTDGGSTATKTQIDDAASAAATAAEAAAVAAAEAARAASESVPGG